MATTVGTGTSGAFALALSNFKDNLPREEIQAFTGSTLEDIRKEASAIQAMQEKKGMLRNMRRIQPLINGLTQFSGVIEVFVQAKPEVLAFIWGPMKFLLQVASSYTLAYDKLLNAFEKLGENLNRFQVFEQTFHDVPRMQEVIVIIYEDILGFYQVILSYFRGKYWRNLFRSVWSTFDERFGKILSDLDQHKALVDSEATATNIAEARAARQAAQIAEETARTHRDKQNILQIREWLHPVNYDAFLAKLGSPYRTTGLWFVQEDSVQAWLDMTDKSNRLLWLTGIPGAGKTFLSASFLRHTQSIYDKNVPIAYSFLSHDNDNTSAMILRTLISQLLHHNLQPLTYFDEIRESKTHPPSSQEEVQEMFKFILGDIGVSYLFIDGLDEIDIEERKMVLDTLCSLLVEAEHLKIFLSSRAEVDISRSLTKVEVVGHVHRVDLAGKNQQDIKTYITEEGKGVFEKFTSLDEDTRQQVQGILDRVCDRAEGMFLWARLVIYDLKSQIDMEGLEDAVHNLPVGLDAAYGRIVNRINEKLSVRERDLARRILGWVMCSSRPLSLNELKQALAIREGDSCINKRRIILIRLDELCGPVIEFDAEDNIHFVHFTAKEYLTSKYSGMFIRYSDAHQDIAITCITYLSFSCFDINITDEEVKENILSGDYCLHLYAERNWMYHVKHAIELDHDDSWTQSFVSLLVKFVQLRLDESLPQMVANQDIPSDGCFLEILNPSTNVQRHLINYYIFNSGEGLSKGISFDPFTLQKSTKRFRQNLEDIFTSSSMSNDQDQLQSIYKNYGGNIFKCSRVQCLHYVNGFDTQNKRDEHLDTHTRPFPCNVQGCDFVSIGFATMVTLKAHLRRYHQTYFSDIDTQTRGHSSLSNCPPLGTLDLTNLLFDTISTGNVSMVKGVLELGVDLNCGTFNNNGESFLHYTLRAGHKDIFQLLLEKGASADTMNREPRATILNSAISKGSIEYVELLLEWGARVNRLEEGISANTVDVSNIPPPLIVAIRNNQKESVRLLLENGADAESKDLHGNEAMFHAIQTSSDMVKLLLEKGASANTISAGGIFPKLPRGTPALIVAIKNDQKESVRLLLEKGADVNWVDRDGNTALIYAVKKSPDIVKLLLEKGASANTMTSAGIAALILAIQNDQSESVRLLLEKGADTSSKDWNGEAALILAIKKSPDMVKLLLETGASANIIVINTIMWTGSMFPRLPRGTPALIVAIKKDEKESVRLLLEKGADVESKDSDGNPALISALEKSPDMVKLLLEKGASANIIVINTIMWTGSMFPRLPRGTPALIVAIKKDEKESVRLLLEKGADVESKDSDGNPALILAIKESPDMVKLLLEKGESANTISSDRIPALILAIQNDQSKSVRLLLEKGADANTKDPKGEAAIFHVARITYPYREMLPSKMDKTNESKLAIIKLLISAGISVNIKDSQGTPILVLVALSRKLRVSAEFLISRGAERDVEVGEKFINKLGVLQKTDALFEAIYFGMIKAVTTLIENGARVDSPDKAGVTPLMAAIVSPYYEYPILKTLLERLLNARSSVNYVNKKTNDSAVLLAAQRITADSAADELKLLLRHGANIDMTDRRGQTALHKMAGKKHIFAARALLEHGARADIRDKQGKTALTIWPELSQTILSMSESQSSLQSSVPLSMDET